MNVSLTPKLEALVQKKVKSGLYQSASEVIREAVRILDERDTVRSIQFEKLRRDIEMGMLEANSGNLIPSHEVFRKIRNHHSKHKDQ